jgi:hypothetical protein
MIRFITTSSHFIDLKKDGFIKLSDIFANPKKKGYIVFEKDWKGDGYFKGIFISRNAAPGHSILPADLIALMFDEHDLLLKGYQIHELSDSDETTELKSMVRRNELSENELKGIGDLVCIKDDIPLSYMVNVDIPDEKRLGHIGLNISQ